MSRIAVVGHVEWVRFIAVDAFPQRGGVTPAREWFAHAGGGAVVAAAVLAEHGAEVNFFCALGRDADGEAAARELSQRGVRAHVAWREQPTRGVVTLLESSGQRAIVTLGERLEPHADDDLGWASLNTSDGVYLTAGDAGAAVAARHGRVLVATPRARQGLHDSGVAIDALVFSAHDPDERRWAERLGGQARVMVQTEGAQGGRWWGESEGRWPSVPVPGPVRDDYGCGDAFAAALTLGLAEGRSMLDAAGLGARAGAEMATRSGAP